MPRAPRSGDDESVEAYLESLEALHERLDEGMSWSGHERNCVFLNTGRGSNNEVRFAKASAVSGLDFADDGRGLALFDWDQDGDLDLAIANRTAPRVRLMRNALPPTSQFVDFRLEGNGVGTNRDAVGARLVVSTSEGTSVRTVRAGDGFLSQSSLWLHVGLGSSELDGSVVVRWPGGGEESFDGVIAGRRYRLVQGTGRAEVEPPRRGFAELAAVEQQPQPVTTGERVLLTPRLPSPSLTLRPFSAAPDAKADSAVPIAIGRQAPDFESGKPVLVNFWASWCVPCRKELREFAAQADAIRDAGLDIVALSTDGLGADPPTRAQDGEKLMDEIQFPFVSGLATDETLDKVQIIERSLFDRKFPLALPFSLLIDNEGRVAAILRGPTEPSALLSDLALLDGEQGLLRSEARIFAGRTFSPAPEQVSIASYARWFEDDYPDEAMALLERAVEEARAELGATQGRELLRRAAGSPVAPEGLAPEDTMASQEWARLQARAELVEALQRLALLRGGRGDHQAAVDLSRAVLELEPADELAQSRLLSELFAMGALDELEDELERRIATRPEDTSLRVRLAEVLDSRGDDESALRELARAAVLDPGDARLHFLSAQLQIQRGDLEAAIEQLEVTTRLAPDDQAAHLLLAFGAARQGNAEKAIAHFERVLEIDPRSTDARQGLARTYAATGRPDEAISHFELLLESTPADASVHQGLALALFRLDRIGESVEHLRRAYQLDEQYLSDAVDVAWLLATHPDPERRNGEQALLIARDADQRTGSREPRVLETLAAALAESGRFDEAVETVERTIRLAKEAGLEPEVEKLEDRRQLYRSGRPFRLPER